MQLSKCCVEAENIQDHQRLFNEIKDNSPSSYGTVESVAIQAVSSSIELGVKNIIAITHTGSLARALSKYRPACQVVAFTFDQKVALNSELLRGVQGILLDKKLHDKPDEDLVEEMIREAISKKCLNPGERVIVVHGINEDFSDEACVVRILTA